MTTSPSSSPGSSRRIRWIAPLMAIAVIVLLAALWSGLVHLGLPIPEGGNALHKGHGPLIVLGFLGTLIAVERAVALGKAWAYAAPVAAATSGVAVLVAAPDRVAPALATLGGVLLVAIFVVVHRIQPSLHNTVLTGGAVSWVVAGVLWFVGWEVWQFVAWLVAFLILTITGERLELSRLTGATRRSRALFMSATTVFGLGLLSALAVPATGTRIAGVGLVGLAAWLSYYDIARRTVRQRGVTRFMAIALLTGYGWLAVGGALWAAVGEMSGTGWAYDAMLHAVFVGFVLSMIFAHAPVIFPAVLGKPLPYRSLFYIPLALLHTTLLLRLIGGDALGNSVLLQWGGVLNEIALLLYLGMAAGSMMWADRPRATVAASSPQPTAPTFTLDKPESRS